MNATLAEIGAGLLALFALLQWQHILPTVRTFAGFVGVCLIAAGATGALGFDLVINLVKWVESLLSDLTNWLFHVRVGALVLVIFLGGFVLINLHPKNKTHKHTGLAAIALALVLLVGVAQIPALSNIPPSVRSGVSNAQSTVNGG